MKISFSATNPCHLYDLAKALHARGALARYHSGYPRWKLHPPAAMPVTAHSARTLVTYGWLRLPRSLQPAAHRLFRWQDRGFDRAVAAALNADDGDWLHALPGQALETFRAARARGIRPVLNHASGPVRQQLALVEGEFRRAGVSLAAHHGFDADYFRREDEEYALADRHCVASSIVRTQLIAAGVAAERIWVVPYGADPAVFFPPADSTRRNPLQLIYAGQLTLRKGLTTLFAAVEQVRRSHPVELHVYGGLQPDFAGELDRVRDQPWLRLHGTVRQAELADALRAGALLVLPSWEEAFGLVVPQALSCGLPCIVSDRVGAADLIEPRRNGSVFPVGDAAALATEIAWWLAHASSAATAPQTWEAPAERLRALSALVP